MARPSAVPCQAKVHLLFIGSSGLMKTVKISFSLPVGIVPKGAALNGWSQGPINGVCVCVGVFTCAHSRCGAQAHGMVTVCGLALMWIKLQIGSKLNLSLA